MIKPDQRTPADCMRCCVATVLGLDYDDVPDFVADHDDGWSAALGSWAEGRGYALLRVQTKRLAMTAMAPGAPAYWIADGPGPRGCDHAVVFHGEDMDHDPHPSRAGILSMHGATVFVPIVPSADAEPPPPSDDEVVGIVAIEPEQGLIDELSSLLEDAKSGALTGMVSVFRQRGGENITVCVGLNNLPMLIGYAARIQRRAMDDWVNDALT